MGSGAQSTQGWKQQEESLCWWMAAGRELQAGAGAAQSGTGCPSASTRTYRRGQKSAVPAVRLSVHLIKVQLEEGSLGGRVFVEICAWRQL